MKKYFFLIIELVGMLTGTLIYTFDNIRCENIEVMTSPEYRGTLYGGFTWLYLRSMPTDGDLETGTLITLTTPPNLFARLQQLQSSPSSAFRVNLGYSPTCTDYNLDFTYFHYKGTDSAQIKNITVNQLIQSFLGGAYSTLDSSEKQKIHQANFIFGKQCIIDQRLILHPYFGLGYANINRSMNVKFTGLIDAPPSVTNSKLTGLGKSKYWGLGPIFGSDFSFSILPCMSLQGGLEGGVLLGTIKSSIDALETNVEDNTTITTPFNAADSNYRTMPLVKGQLAFAFHPTLKTCNIDCELKVGYEIDYYFNAIDRINPFNGFVVNQNSFPVKQTSHVSLGGPFLELTIMNTDDSYYAYYDHCPKYNYTKAYYDFNNIYCEINSAWVKPVSTNDDLVYAILNKKGGLNEKQKASFNHSWNGTYKLGYQSLHDYDVHIAFSPFHDESSTRVSAQNGESITSVNASGDASVLYSAAQSKVTYDINKAEFLAGKWFLPLCKLEMLLSGGLRYVSLQRTIKNQYTGGMPPENFESKSNFLKSKFRGAGPVFAMKPQYSLCENLQLTGYLATSLVVGRLKATLDQVNQGTVDASSNTLRSPNTRFAVPIVDASAGLSYRFCLPKFNFKIEAGYQFAGYFKAINLIFPVFLTGLQQNNSDLKLHGPYLDVTYGFKY